MKAKLNNKFLKAYVLACAAIMAALAFVLTEANWDMLAYAAIVQESEASNSRELHRQVYAQAQARLSDEQYRDITSRTSYREVMAADAEAFQQQLPYYRIKVLYTSALELLVASGLDVFLAARVLVISCAFLSLLVLYKAFETSIAPAFWLLFPALIILGGVLKTARLVTPDSMALLLMALAVYFHLRSHWLLYIVLLFCVLVRTDLLIFVYAMLFLKAYNAPSSSLTVVIVGVAAMLVYYIISKLYGAGYGWAVLFHFVIESKMLATHPLEYLEVSIAPLTYIKLMAVNIPRVVFYPGFWFFGFCSVLALLLVWGRTTARSWQARLSILLAHPLIGVVLVSIVYVLAHVLLFPLWEVRYFVAPYTFSALCLLGILSEASPSTAAGN